MGRFGGCVTSARRRTCGTSKGSCRTSTGADSRGLGPVWTVDLVWAALVVGWDPGPGSGSGSGGTQVRGWWPGGITGWGWWPGDPGPGLVAGWDHGLELVAGDPGSGSGDGRDPGPGSGARWAQVRGRSRAEPRFGVGGRAGLRFGVAGRFEFQGQGWRPGRTQVRDRWPAGTTGRGWRSGVLSAFDGVGVLLGRDGRSAVLVARRGLRGVGRSGRPVRRKASVDGRSRCPARVGSSSGSVRECLKSMSATAFCRTGECVGALLGPVFGRGGQMHVAPHAWQVGCARLSVGSAG
ncbi:hypothetical protein LX86_009832 [Lentzea aerocolonigenes]|nr:hypothetical protein [Lentzea aerocolonigenes]